jgi:hypothetical protein
VPALRTHPRQAGMPWTGHATSGGAVVIGDADLHTAALVYTITGDPDALAEAKETLDIYVGNGVEDFNCTDRRGVTLTSELRAALAAAAGPPTCIDGRTCAYQRNGLDACDMGCALRRSDPEDVADFLTAGPVPDPQGTDEPEALTAEDHAAALRAFSEQRPGKPDPDYVPPEITGMGAPDEPTDDEGDAGA